MGIQWYKKSDVFHIILLNLCISGTFLTSEGKWENEVYLEFEIRHIREFKCCLCVAMATFTAFISLDDHHIRKMTRPLLSSQNSLEIRDDQYQELNRVLEFRLCKYDMKKQIYGLLCSHSLISSSVSQTHTCTQTRPNFVSRTLWNVAIFWALLFIPKTFCSWLCCLFSPGEDAHTFRSTTPLRSLRLLLSSPHKRMGGKNSQS